MKKVILSLACASVCMIGLQAHAGAGARATSQTAKGAATATKAGAGVARGAKAMGQAATKSATAAAGAAATAGGTSASADSKTAATCERVVAGIDTKPLRDAGVMGGSTCMDKFSTEETKGKMLSILSAMADHATSYKIDVAEGNVAQNARVVKEGVKELGEINGTGFAKSADTFEQLCGCDNIASALCSPQVLAAVRR